MLKNEIQMVEVWHGIEYDSFYWGLLCLKSSPSQMLIFNYRPDHWLYIRTGRVIVMSLRVPTKCSQFTHHFFMIRASSCWSQNSSVNRDWSESVWFNFGQSGVSLLELYNLTLWNQASENVSIKLYERLMWAFIEVSYWSVYNIIWITCSKRKIWEKIDILGPANTSYLVHEGGGDTSHYSYTVNGLWFSRKPSIPKY